MKLVIRFAAYVVVALACASLAQNKSLESVNSLVRRGRSAADVETMSASKKYPVAAENLTDKFCKDLSAIDYCGLPMYSFSDPSLEKLTPEQAYNKIFNDCSDWILGAIPDYSDTHGPWFDKEHRYSKHAETATGGIYPFSKQKELFVICDAFDILDVAYYDKNTDMTKLKAMVASPFGRGTVTKRFLKEVYNTTVGNEITYESTPCPQ